MKILQLCNKPPYPPVDGGTMAMNSITQGLLQAGCQVRVLTVETDKHPAKRELMGDNYLNQTNFHAVYIDLNVRPLSAAVAMLCGESYHVKRYRSESFAAELRKVLEQGEFDVIHVPILRKYSKAKVILRAHNVEHLIWKHVAQSTHNHFKRSYLKHLSLTLRAYELEHLNDYDGVVCITRNDAEYFSNNGLRRPVTNIPFGMEPKQVSDIEVEPGSLFHIGAMDWMPNQESITWLLNEVWPVVHRQVPQAHLYLAGRKMPERLMSANIEGVSVVGEVDDATAFIAGKQINIVPLLSGSGIRVKIIEAMSAGKVVVTTTIGAQGIDYTDGVNLLIANTPEEFAKQIKHCLDDETYCRSVGQAAAQLIKDHYDEQKLTDELLQFYNQILAK